MTSTQPLAIVGSPSTNSHITLDLLESATGHPLVGQLLYLEQTMNDCTELALGTVTEVTTNNRWHTDASFRGVIRERGEIPGMSGDVGDTRAASINLQATYRQHDPVGPWSAGGPSFRMSPATGTKVRQVSNSLVADLVSTTPDLHYLGNLHDTDVRAPFNMRDFSGDRGAYHLATFGMTGSGKTGFSSYLLASLMRHPRLGMIIIDPQGQWSGEAGLPFSVQAWAAEIGRDVVVRRIAEDLRMDKDASLFGQLLSKTRFLPELMKMSAETQELVTDEIVKVTRATSGWEEMSTPAFLDALLTGLMQPHVLRNVYADLSRRERLLTALAEVRGEAPTHDCEGNPATPGQYAMPSEAVMQQRRDDVIAQLLPLHNLFASHNPAGAPRHSLWGAIKSVFDSDPTKPAPVLILDMSTAAGVSWLDLALADDDQLAAAEATRILDQDAIKAAILRRTCQTLKNASEDAFRDGTTLNTMVVLDEAWRYAPPPHTVTEPEIKELSNDLAGYARDTRKFGIGWFYITQSPRSLNPDIWDQLAVRFIGYGLAGADLAKVGEVLDTTDHLNLYRGFAPPDARTPRQYPFMISGPVSPLSLTRAPLFIDAPTNFDDFRVANASWIEPLRLALGQQVLTGTPARPATGRPRPATSSKVTSTGSTSVRARRGLEQVRQHRATGGVDPAAGVGLATGTGFGTSLSEIDDDTPPF